MKPGSRDFCFPHLIPLRWRKFVGRNTCTSITCGKTGTRVGKRAASLRNLRRIWLEQERSSPLLDLCVLCGPATPNHEGHKAEGSGRSSSQHSRSPVLSEEAQFPA